MANPLEQIVDKFAAYSEEKYAAQNLVYIAKSFNLSLEEFEAKVKERRVTRTKEIASKTEDHTFRVSEARIQHMRNLENLKAANPEGRAVLLRTASLFGGRAFGARLLEGSEENLRAAVRDCAVASGMTETEVEFIDEEWAAGVAQPLKFYTWRHLFHTGNQLDKRPLVMLIDRILPEGVNAIGALSAVGKTWFSLSMARALTTGKPFMGVFSVPVATPVLYLVPEMGERAVRQRLEKMKIPLDDMFFCQTVADGVVRLSDPSLEAAVAELRPVIFLDTAIRFNRSDDENSASQNAQSLARDMFEFRRWGARAIVCLHHSPKYAGDSEEMTLENVLRGTGDLGAMCDSVWGLKTDKTMKGKKWDAEYTAESQAQTRIFVKCVKPRDFECSPPFRIIGRPHIDNRGDFAVVAEFDTRTLDEKVEEAIKGDPEISINTLRERFGIGYDKAKDTAERLGWKQFKGLWEKSLY